VIIKGMSSPHATLDELLDRYLAGDLTPADQGRLGQLLAGLPNDTDRLPALSAALRHALDDGSVQSTSYVKLRDAVRVKIGAGSVHVPGFGGSTHVDATKTVRAASHRHLHGMTWLRTRSTGIAVRATAVLLLVAGSTVVARHHDYSVSTTTARVYTTHRNERTTITFADGSRAVLGPETELRYSDNGENNGSTVDVRGQVSFDVVPDPHRPFIVRTPSLRAQVLGTTFVVRHYTTDHVARVIVANGRVSVSSRTGTNPRGVVATASSMVEVSDSGQTRFIPTLPMAEADAWTKGELVFRGARIDAVVTDVARRYDLDIRATDSAFTHVRLNAVIDAETAQEALDFLAIVLNAQYTRHGKTVTFTPARRALRQTPAPRLSPTLEHTYGR
jgi:ferric-dicitrate binding protein FerR (iron transport regulator)